VIDGSHVAFSGNGSSGQAGVYLFDGSTLKVIANTSTPLPNRTAHFSWASHPAISGNNVAFFGLKGPCGLTVFLPNCKYKSGVYVFDGSTLSQIADTKTAIPRGTGNFTGMGAPVISGRRVAFLGLGQPGQAGIYLATPSRHDLALVSITAPKLVTQGSGPQRVKVQIQNRGNHDEVITSASLGNGVTSGLVRLDVSALGVDDDAEKCQPAGVSLNAARNAARFNGGSATLEPAATLAVHFLVTYNCLAAKFKPTTDTTWGDYRHVASVFHAALGAPDHQPADDICPRDPLPGGVDASPVGAMDHGCGARKPAGTLGDPVLTDVVPPAMR
jgi:hypothetical protein